MILFALHNSLMSLQLGDMSPLANEAILDSMFCEFVFAKKEVRPATVSGVGSVLGTVAGMVIKIIVGVLMIAWFLVDVIWI